MRAATSRHASISERLDPPAPPPPPIMLVGIQEVKLSALDDIALYVHPRVRITRKNPGALMKTLIVRKGKLASPFVRLKKKEEEGGNRIWKKKHASPIGER